MGLRDVLAALRRNLVIIVLLLVASAVATAYVWTRVPVTYQSKATMIVLLPKTSTEAGMTDQPVNPYLQAGTFSTQVAASALANVSSSDEFVAALHGVGVTGQTTVDVATYGGGVVLELSSENPRADQAPKDVRLLSEQLSTELAQRQKAAGAPDGTYITVTDLTQPSASTTVTTNRTKMTGVAGAIGLVVTLAVTVLVDGARRRRTQRRAARRQAALPPLPEPLTVPPAASERGGPEPVGAMSAGG